MLYGTENCDTLLYSTALCTLFKYVKHLYSTALCILVKYPLQNYTVKCIKLLYTALQHCRETLVERVIRNTPGH